MKKFLRAIGSQVPLLLILLVGSFPYWASLGYWPTTTDMPTWIAAGAMSNPGWAEWVFEESHFSWYRPVTALSFTLVDAMSGLEPLGYRLFDLAFHLGAGCLCLGLLRWLAPNLSRWALLLALLLFLAHPGGEEVVPFMSRRSFSLALFFGLGALSILARELRTVPAGRAPASLCLPATIVGLLFVAALYSSEGALVLIGMAPLVALQIAGERKLPARSWLLPALIPVLLIGAALAWRQHVLGGPGGTFDESLTDLAGVAPGQGSLVGDSLFALLGLPVLARNLGKAGEILGFVSLAAAAVLFARALIVSLARWDRPGERLLFGLAAWTLAILALFVVTDTWAPRHTYFAQVPLALLLASALGNAAGIGPGGESSPRSPISRLQTASAALVIVVLLVASPIVHGRDPDGLWAERNAVIENLVGGLDGVQRPVVVHVALPYLAPEGAFPVPGDVGVSPPDSVRQPLGWANLVLSQKGIDLVDLVYYPLEAGPQAFTLERPDREAAFVAAPAQDYLLRTGSKFDYRGPDSERRIELLPIPVAPERGVYSLLCTTEGSSVQLVRVPIRTEQGAEGEAGAPPEAESDLDSE